MDAATVSVICTSKPSLYHLSKQKPVVTPFHGQAINRTISGLPVHKSRLAACTSAFNSSSGSAFLTCWQMYSANSFFTCYFIHNYFPLVYFFTALYPHTKYVFN